MRKASETKAAVEETKALSWQAVRRGHIYCAPACGGKCTGAAFQLATDRAEALCKRFVGVWKPRVHENLGWFAGAVYAGGHMNVSIHDYSGVVSYSAFIDTDKGPGGRWHGNGDTPEKAIEEARAMFGAELSSLHMLQELLKGAP